MGNKTLHQGKDSPSLQLFKNNIKTWRSDRCQGQICSRYFANVGFFSIWVIYEHSPLTGQQGKGEAVYLIPLYHFPLHSTETLVGQLLQIAHICT